MCDKYSYRQLEFRFCVPRVGLERRYSTEIEATTTSE